MMGFVWTRERATADGTDLSLWFHFFSPSCSRVWLVNWPFKKKKKRDEDHQPFPPFVGGRSQAIYRSPWSKFSFIYIINIFFSLIVCVWTFLRIIRHTQHHDLENKARMNWPRLLSTINTNNKKTHDGLVDLSLRRFDIYQNKTKQNKQKREFSAAAAFLLVCLIENQQQFTVTIVSFLLLFVFPIFHCWFKFLIASCIYCVCIDTRRARGFRSDFPPRLYLFYKLKQKKSNAIRWNHLPCGGDVGLWAAADALCTYVRTTLAPERAARVPYRRTSHNHEIFEWWICCCFFLLCVNKAGDGLDWGKESLEGGRRWDNPSSI